MEIYDVLKRDHSTLKDLLERLLHSQDASDQARSDLIEKVLDELVTHSRAEERVFYNALRSIHAAQDLVAHSYLEHVEAETLLRTLQAMKAMDADWTKTAQKLKGAIEHHIHEEETRVFTAAQQLFIKEEAEAMAEAFEQLKPKIREGNIVQSTVDLIANLMPSRFAAPFREMTSH